MVCLNNDEPYLTGVVSFGHPICGNKDMPGVYTKISSFKKEILRFIEKMGIPQ